MPNLQLPNSSWDHSKAISYAKQKAKRRQIMHKAMYKRNTDIQSNNIKFMVQEKVLG